MIKQLLFVNIAIFSLNTFAQALPTAPDANANETAAPAADDGAAALLASFKFETGKITLPNGVATLDLPANFRYLSPTDTEKLLVDVWGNSPGNETLVMIIPT